MTIMDTNLPEIYKKGGKDCYLDPIRKRLIYITPEETVRQHILSYLLEEISVPENMIRVEERLSHYGVSSKKRADIIIDKYNKEDDIFNPLAVIECKAPGVLIGEKAINQVVGYADELGCDYVMLSNGETSVFYKYHDGEYIMIEELPLYLEMIKQDFVPYKTMEKLPRIAFEELPQKSDEYLGYFIGESTDKLKREMMANFLETILYLDSGFALKQYKIFKVIKDYGVRLLEYGNHGGGYFSGPYRSFLIEYEGSTEFVSIGVSTYVTSARMDYIRTTINVAIDNEKETHHSVQIVVDENMQIIGNRCRIYHHGRIGVSNLGSGKVSELRTFVDEEMPELIDGNRFFMGELCHDKLWSFDQPEFEKLIENLISYALIRDKYRAWIKKNKISK